MTYRRRKTFTLLAALSATVVLAFTSACMAFNDAQPQAKTVLASAALDQPAPPEPSRPPIGPVVIPKDKPDQPPVVQPPTPEPEPDVIVLKPGQNPADVDANGKFTGDASFDRTDDSHVKHVYIVEGRTIDDTGRAVPGAQVWLVLYNGAPVRADGLACCEPDIEICRPRMRAIEVRGFSDRSGRYRLRVTYYAPQDARFAASVHATCPGFAQGATNLDANAGPEARADVTLCRGATVTGRVIDALGRSLAGVRVYAYGEQTAGEAITEEDGSFTIDGMSAGAVIVYAYLEGYRLEQEEGTPIELFAGQPIDAGVLMLHSRASVAWQMDLKDKEASDYVYGNVSVYDHDGRLVADFWFEAGRDKGLHHGLAYVDGLADGVYRVIVRAQGEKTWQAEATISVRDGQRYELGVLQTSEVEGAPEPHDGGMSDSKPMRPRVSPAKAQ